MQLSEQLSAALTADHSAEPMLKGPALIDPVQFKLVAGGSPKGGWNESTAIAAAIEDPFSPKGGW